MNAGGAGAPVRSGKTTATLREDQRRVSGFDHLERELEVLRILDRQTRAPIVIERSRAPLHRRIR